MTTSKRKHHPLQPGSKRSQRRQRAIDRAAYFDDKQALVLGAPVVTFAAARAVVLRAAFGRGSDGSLPDEGTVWPRVWSSYDKHVSIRVRAEYRQDIMAEVEGVVEDAIALQNVRSDIRSVRALRQEPLPESKSKQWERRVAIKAHCVRVRAILTDLGRPIPAEFREG